MNILILAAYLKGIGSAAVLIGGLGIMAGALLGIAAARLEVKMDEREETIKELLPGNNCGACGFAGCGSLAAAIHKGETLPNACPVADSTVHEQIAAVTGTIAEERKRMAAFVKCRGTCDKTRVKYNYYGIMDCNKAANIPGGGARQCGYGCMGLGSCTKVCQFDAIQIVDGIAVIDKDKCTSCGLCVKTCPKKVIELKPYDTFYAVLCNSREKGKEVKSACDIGCIGCTLCVRNCEHKAIDFKDNLASIDSDKCVGCGICAEKCPTGNISRITKQINVS
jgi:Na+-translocating ferredoxin:NAD+ oxidoreductase RNF subunit RnfB